MRHRYETYRDVVKACPMIYTRLLKATRVNTDIMGYVINRGLVERRREKNWDSTRKKVWMVYATEKGRVFADCVNTAEELLK